MQVLFTHLLSAFWYRENGLVNCVLYVNLCILIDFEWVMPLNHHVSYVDVSLILYTGQHFSRFNISPGHADRKKWSSPRERTRKCSESIFRKSIKGRLFFFISSSLVLSFCFALFLFYFKFQFVS